MILSATSRSLLTQDMGGDGFPKGIADGLFRVARLRMERVLHRACGRLGGPTVALKLREATPNEHGLKAARPCVTGTI